MPTRRSRVTSTMISRSPSPPSPAGMTGSLSLAAHCCARMAENPDEARFCFVEVLRGDTNSRACAPTHGAGWSTCSYAELRRRRDNEVPRMQLELPDRRRLPGDRERRQRRQHHRATGHDARAHVARLRVPARRRLAGFPRTSPVVVGLGGDR